MAYTAQSIEVMTSPTTANDDFRQTRTTTVQALLKSSQANASQFLLLTVSPLGHVEVHTSDALTAYADTTITHDMRQEAYRLSHEALKNRPAGAWSFEQPSTLSEARHVQKEPQPSPVPEQNRSRPSSPLKASQQTFAPRTRARGGSIDELGKSILPSSPGGSPPPNVNVTFPNETALLKFYIAQFSSLHQDLCKRLAKQWIKMFEPAKCTKCVKPAP
jgi:hypothetical protein